jgi:hypothetical protein
LSSFISSGQENNQLTPTLFKIHPIAGTIIDPQLGDSLANRLNIAGVSPSEALNPDLDTSPRLDVAEFFKPMYEEVSFSNFDHEITVAARLHVVNGKFVPEGAQRMKGTSPSVRSWPVSAAVTTSRTADRSRRELVSFLGNTAAAAKRDWAELPKPAMARFDCHQR